MISRLALRIIALNFAVLPFAASPLAAEAQQPGKVHRIGFLSYFGCAKSVAPDGAFGQTLRSLGYVQGQNIVIECRDALGRADRLPDRAVELVNLSVDVLVAETIPAALAAKRATSTIMAGRKKTSRDILDTSKSLW